MSHRPQTILKGLLATVIAMGAAVVLATPALADTYSVKIGSYLFTSASSLTNPSETTVASDPANAGTVLVKGGSADIKVEKATPDAGATEVNTIVIGAADDGYAGTVTFDSISADALSVVVNGPSTKGVVFDDCTVTGVTGKEAILTGDTVSTSITLSGTTSITGGAGASGVAPGEGKGAIVCTSACTITVTDDAIVTGGAGGTVSAATGTRVVGGPGIAAPGSSFTMEKGSLNVKAGATGTGGDVDPDTEETPLPVAFTVGKINLTNGTGVKGGGPQITAAGWPNEDTPALDLSGVIAGDPDSDAFYPWLLQVSEDLSGTNPHAVAYAGTGLQSVERDTSWRWFNIAPHAITGAQMNVQVVEPEADAGDLATYVQAETVAPTEEAPAAHQYGLYLTPVFDGVDGLAVPASLSTNMGFEDPTLAPEGNALWVNGAESGDGIFYVPPTSKGKTITVSATADLTGDLATLYPSFTSDPVSTQLPVVYTVTAKPNGGTFGTSTEPVTYYTAADGSGTLVSKVGDSEPAVTIPAPTAPGTEGQTAFIGYFDETGTAPAVVDVSDATWDANATLTAEYGIVTLTAIDPANAQVIPGEGTDITATFTVVPSSKAITAASYGTTGVPADWNAFVQDGSTQEPSGALSLNGITSETTDVGGVITVNTQVTVNATDETPSGVYSVQPTINGGTFGTASSVPKGSQVVVPMAVYRLYNKWAGTHLYTTDLTEVKTNVGLGWTNEGAYWYAPIPGTSQASYEIIRLRNPFNGDHYYVKADDSTQIAYLTGLGWERDSAASSIWSCAAGGDDPVYTLFNPHSQVDTHLYTPQANEVRELTGIGWREDSTIIWATALPPTE